MNKKSESFEGLPRMKGEGRKSYQKNYMQVPHEVTDKLLRELTANQFKIFFLILRKTDGWGREFAKISISEFTRETNLSRTTAYKVLKQLIEGGYVERRQVDSSLKSFYKYEYGATRSEPYNPFGD